MTDTERLDFLANRVKILEFTSPKKATNNQWVLTDFSFGIPINIGKGNTVREAIDAGIEKYKEIDKDIENYAVCSKIS